MAASFAVVVLAGQSPAPAADVPVWVFLAFIPILSGLFFAIFRRMDALQVSIYTVSKDTLEADRRLEARLDLHDREMRVWNRVAEDRLLRSFEQETTYRGTASEEERRFIGWVRRMGANSPAVTAGDIERVIQIIDRELDAGHIVENKVPEAKYELQRLNAVLVRKQGEGDVPPPPPVRSRIESATPWWRFW